jgi:hypothetical protein
VLVLFSSCDPVILLSRLGEFMQVNRQFIKVKQRQVVIELPETFLNHRVEVIALTVDENKPRRPKRVKRRRPHPEIAGKGQTLGDLINPIVDEADWACLP